VCDIRHNPRGRGAEHGQLVETRAPHGTTLSEKHEHGSEYWPSGNLVVRDSILVRPSDSLPPPRNILVDTSINLSYDRGITSAGSKLGSVSNRRGRVLHALILMPRMAVARGALTKAGASNDMAWVHLDAVHLQLGAI
jgi:hypothetical protein